jgi:hypothetical protein
MDRTIRKILNELNQLKNEYDKSSAEENDDTERLYGKYWGVRESIEIIERHIKEG